MNYTFLIIAFITIVFIEILSDYLGIRKHKQNDK